MDIRSKKGKKKKDNAQKCDDSTKAGSTIPEKPGKNVHTIMKLGTKIFELDEE